MRSVVWPLAVLAASALAGSASAQKSLSSLGGISPSQLVYKQVDLGNAAVPTLPPTTQKPFSLTNFFSRIPIPGLAKNVAVSPLPVPASFPSTRYRNALQPVAPQKQVR